MQAMHAVWEGTLFHSRRPQSKVTLTFPTTQTPVTSSKAYKSFLRTVLFKCIKSNAWDAREQQLH